jgi:excisionase family DNA binding protein
MAEDRLTVEEAARRLGVKEDAIRKRIFRGTLRSERDEDGHRYVFLDASKDRSKDRSKDELVEALRDEIAHLRRESERKDTIIMSLSQANAEMSRTIRAIEAPSSAERPPDDAESAGEPQGGGDVPQEPETATQRPWWRRWLG